MSILVGKTSLGTGAPLKFLGSSPTKPCGCPIKGISTLFIMGDKTFSTFLSPVSVRGTYVGAAMPSTIASSADIPEPSSLRLAMFMGPVTIPAIPVNAVRPAS